MAHIEKRDRNRWRARYRGPDGHERSPTFSRRIDADRFLASVESAMARGEWVDPCRGRTTVGEWAEQWLDRRQSTEGHNCRRLQVVASHLRPSAVERRSLSRGHLRGRRCLGGGPVPAWVGTIEGTQGPPRDVAHVDAAVLTAGFPGTRRWGCGCLGQRRASRCS